MIFGFFKFLILNFTQDPALLTNFLKINCSRKILQKLEKINSFFKISKIRNIKKKSLKKIKKLSLRKSRMQKKKRKKILFKKNVRNFFIIIKE